MCQCGFPAEPVYREGGRPKISTAISPPAVEYGCSTSSSLYFLKAYTFYFPVVVDVRESFAGGTELPLSPLLTCHLTVEHLQPAAGRGRYRIMNGSPFLLQIPLAFTFVCPRTLPRIPHDNESSPLRRLHLAVAVSQTFLVFGDV